jgi:hypothetical protein
MEQYSAQQQPQTSSNGCSALVAFTAFVVAIILLGIGAFLPPFSLYDRLFGVQYATLQLSGDSIASVDSGLRIVNINDSAGFGVNIETTSLMAFTVDNGETNTWIPVARSSIPPYLALQSNVYQIQHDDKPSGGVMITIAMPNTASADVLSMYGYDRVKSQWHFIPSRLNNGRVEATTTTLYDDVALFQTAPLAPVVAVQYDVTQMLDPNVANLADIISPAGLQPTVSGALTGSLAPGFDTNASYLLMPVIRDFADPRALDTETVVAILSNTDLRREHVRQLSSLAGGGFDGVWIDYRGVPAEQRDNFSAFIRELSTSFGTVGLQLGVIVPYAENKEGMWDTGAYDWRVIGQYTNYLQINMPLNPNDYRAGQNEFVEAMMRWAVGEVDRYKILTGLTSRSVRDIAGNLTTIGYDESLAGLGNVVVEAESVNENGIVQPGSTIRARLDGQPAIAGVDTRVNTAYIDYLDGQSNPVARMWLTTGGALRWRMDMGTMFALGGSAFDDLIYPDLASDILTSITDYKTQIPSAPSPTDLVLRWRVEGSSGLLQEQVTGIGQELVVPLNAPDGNYAVNVAVITSGEEQEESVRSGAAVAMFAPTPTPTPLPTATPTPIPTNTPTPAPIVATLAPPPSSGGGGNNFGAVAPGAGSIRLGQFEYGGHVTTTSGRVVDYMRRAGMTWMKVQVRYPASINDVAGYINGAKSNGFKILIGAVGSPADVASGGDGYFVNFANWLGTVASLGPDAIEVWNEPNLDREWPAGQISGTWYASLLRLSYSAIKQVNPSVIVISAAPGPTGAEAAYPGQVMNDDRWLAEVVAAGGLGYTDCVGVHYNEGIVPPSQSSGDPRDNYYTRYYGTLIDRYWSITNGQKPLCITELGYLSPEGISVPLNPYFAWGQNTTVSQQAAWLAQATAISSQSGRVKLMIVWNVDFQYYGTDPMGGFAIIRPDGSCPACDALAGAR